MVDAGSDRVQRSTGIGRSLVCTLPNYISFIRVKRWNATIAILAYPNWDRNGNREHQQELVKRAYQNASAEFVKILLKLIDQENQEHRSVHIIRLVRGCWNPNLAKVIFEKVKDETLTAESVGCLLDDLLAYGSAEAKTFAESLVPSLPPKNDQGRAKAIVADRVLMLYAEDAGWSVVTVPAFCSLPYWALNYAHRQTAISTKS